MCKKGGPHTEWRYELRTALNDVCVSAPMVAVSLMLWASVNPHLLRDTSPLPLYYFETLSPPCSTRETKPGGSCATYALALRRGSGLLHTTFTLSPVEPTAICCWHLPAATPEFFPTQRHLDLLIQIKGTDSSHTTYTGQGYCISRVQDSSVHSAAVAWSRWGR